MGLNKEQQEAVSYLDGPLLVLAGPGTGKTQLLSAKVAYILENTDTNPENILCLTFSESGASNMRERLGSMIGRAATDVNIYTYHAFGANILERYKNYAENFDRSLDSPIDGVTQFKFVHDIRENLPINDILRTASVNDLVETIQNAKSARLSAVDLQKIAERNLTDNAKISEEVTPYLEQLKPRAKFDQAVSEVYQPILEILASYTNADPIVGGIESTANLLARELAQIIDAETAKEKPSVSPLTKWKNQRFECNTDGSYRLKDYIANKKLLSLAHIMAEYDQKLRADNLFDFADMIEEAIRALREDRGFRLSLSERFQYILLDEFQDTNPSQFELIKLLTDYEAPVVMAVGDDDQAIFEFQGANASNLMDFQNYYQAKVVTLRDNYRSTGEILDFSHYIAKQVTDSFAKQHQVNKVLRSMTDLSQKEPTKNQISRHEFLTANHEYYWVAEEIKRLLQNGENPDDIAVIAPKHKYVTPLLPYLKAQNIDIAYEKKSNLLEDSKIHELIVLAQFVFALANEQQPTHRLLEIFSFPFLEVPALTALSVVQKAHETLQATLNYLVESDEIKLQQIAQWLAQLAMLSFDTPLELWLNYLIGANPMPDGDYRSPYLSYYAENSTPIEQFEFYENLATLRDAVTSHTKNSRPHLADFIAMLEDYTAAEAAIVKTSPYRDNEHAVQVMSAHKSKGLEFKYVFLIAIDDWAWGKSKGNNNTFVLPGNLAQIRHTGATEDERLRLLFVAITRAKSHLIMTNSIQDFSGKNVARLSYLNEQRDEKAEQQISPYLPKDCQEIHTHHQDFDTSTNIETIQYSWAAAYQSLTPELELLLKSNLQNYRLTATDLTTFIDIVYAGPEQIYQKRVLHCPDEPLTPQLAYGNLIHAIFEQVTNQKIDDNAALTLFQDKTTDLALDPKQISDLREKGTHSLQVSLESFREILRHPHAKGEVNLSSEHLMLDGVPLTGKIDHINLNPDTKTIEVYDFKTGNYQKENWQSHFTLYKYALQLEFYKLLLNLSPSYRNYKVTVGHILFVSPDNDGIVHDKVYSYGDAGATEIKLLAKAIYRLITSLDFIHNQEINLTADPKRSVKNVKEFVAKLIELDAK
jgi:DNA helicase-2/ATP-dependent DNA helicase PcrA